MKTIQHLDAFRDIPKEPGTLGMLRSFNALPTWAIDDQLDLIREHRSVVRQHSPHRERLLVLALIERGMAPLL